MININIDIKNDVADYVQCLIKNSPDFIRGCSKSLGYYVQKEIKKDLRSAKSESKGRWARRIPFKIRKDLNARAPVRWYGRLINAIGYQYKAGPVLIGWTSMASAHYGRIQEEGATHQVTSKTREFWGKAGHPLRMETRQLTVPARPFFEPIMNRLGPSIPKYVNQKALDFLNNGGKFAKSIGKGRKYNVFGG